MDTELILDFINQRLAHISNPDRGRMQKKYLKSPFSFYGVSRPDMKAIAREVKNKWSGTSQPELLELCRSLWQEEHHECKSIAIDLLNLFPGHLDNHALDLINHMIDTATGWDHIDEIAIRLVGRLLVRDRKNFKYLAECSHSQNFWKRRVSIIAQLKLYKTENFNRDFFFKVCTEHLYEKEFFIRKAIGWGLRELSKSDPDAVFEFIRQNRSEMSGLTFREGSKHLPDDMRQKLSVQTESIKKNK